MAALRVGFKSGRSRLVWRLAPATTTAITLILTFYLRFGSIRDIGDIPRAKLCPIETIKLGHWVSATYDHPPYTPMRGEVQQRVCDNFDPHSTFHTWEWEPEAAHGPGGCHFSGFEEASYCRIMHNKTLAILGDSISFDHYLALSHLLGVPRSLPRAMIKTALLTSWVCQNSSLLIGKRDFHLNSVGEIIEEFSPDVLVLNRGAHYVPDHELLQHMNEKVFPVIHEWQQKCMDYRKKCFFIWRTTVPGHPNCTMYTQPSDSLDEMETLIRLHPTYNWDKFSAQNELVLDALNKRNLEHEVMDAYFLNILRPDMHNGNDCLHTCLPEDNTYSALLNHILQIKYND